MFALVKNSMRMSNLRYFGVRQQRAQFHLTPTLRLGMDTFGTKKVAVPNDTFKKSLRALGIFHDNVGVDTLNGRDLARNTNEAFGTTYLEHVTEIAKTWPNTYLTPEDRKNGVKNLLLVPATPVEGHLYRSIVECPMSDALANALGDAVGIDDLLWAIATFLSFPGSTPIGFNNFAKTSSGELQDDEVLASGDGNGTARLELGRNNQVYLTSAASLISGKRLSAVSWLNSTGLPHVFDGRVGFSLVPVPEEKVIRLVSDGFGQHPLGIGDAANVQMGVLVFAITLETFVKALEQYVAETKATKLTTEDLKKVAEALEKNQVRLGATLSTKHVLFEMMNLVGGPALQWTRLILGGDTTAPPTSDKSSK